MKFKNVANNSNEMYGYLSPPNIIREVEKIIKLIAVKLSFCLKLNLSFKISITDIVDYFFEFTTFELEMS